MWSGCGLVPRGEWSSGVAHVMFLISQQGSPLSDQQLSSISWPVRCLRARLAWKCNPAPCSLNICRVSAHAILEHTALFSIRRFFSGNRVLLKISRFGWSWHWEKKTSTKEMGLNPAGFVESRKLSVCIKKNKINKLLRLFLRWWCKSYEKQAFTFWFSSV